MANGTTAFDTLSTSGQIQGTAKSVDTDFIVSGSPKVYLHKVADGATNPRSLNVSSVTDSATGKIGVTFSNNMSDLVYVPNMGIWGSNTTVIATFEINEQTTAATTSAVHMETAYVNSSNNKTNLDYIGGMTLTGDLA